MYSLLIIQYECFENYHMTNLKYENIIRKTFETNFREIL